MSRFHTGGRKLLYATLIIRVMPPMVLGLPFFVLFNKVKLVDTLPGLILSYTTFSLPIVFWFLIAFFDDVQAGFLETEDYYQAAIFGTIAASFAIAGFGSHHILQYNKKHAESRQRKFRGRINDLA